MSIGDDVKLKVQSALKPYLCGNYPSHVTNPILLLNYLYQHAIIPSPLYSVICPENHLQRAVSCSIGNLQTIGIGYSNKVAKVNAAQQILDLLLKPVNTTCMLSSSIDVSSSTCGTLDVRSPVSFCNLIADGDNMRTSRNRIRSSNAKSRINNNCTANDVNEITSSSNRVVEPQMSQAEIRQLHHQFNISSENIVKDTSETLHQFSMNASQLPPSLEIQHFNSDTDNFSKNPLQVCPSAIAYEQFFDPFFHNKCPKSVSLSMQPANKNSEEMTLLNKFPVEHQQRNCDAFFDPFFKQRPLNLHSTVKTSENLNQNEIMMEMKSSENCISNEENQSNYTNNELNTMESKNVFALLQKKTQKHFKLIPRFRMENIESGFRCNVQLGSYFASGEGKNKKEAKTKAAIGLLNQIGDLN